MRFAKNKGEMKERWVAFEDQDALRPEFNSLSLSYCDHCSNRLEFRL